jgi:hypothetical protein
LVLGGHAESVEAEQQMVGEDGTQAAGKAAGLGQSV